MLLLVLLLGSCFADPSINSDLSADVYEKYFDSQRAFWLGYSKLKKDNSSDLSKDVVTDYFDQKLDHFGEANGTFKQRYYYNRNFYKPGGPVFIYIGGEGPEYGFKLEKNNCFMMVLAERMGAWVFNIEHRFQGETRPTPNLTAANLKYHNSREAIEDVAYFIEGMKKKFPELAKAKWVSWGASYSGSLAAWVRMKHPEAIDFAVASGAPVFMKLNYFEYLTSFMNAMKYTSATCAETMLKGFGEIYNLTKTVEGRKKLLDELGLCKDLNTGNANDMYTFWQNIHAPYMSLFQLKRVMLNEVCRIHNDERFSTLGRLKLMRKMRYQNFDFRNPKKDCIDVDHKIVLNQYRNTTYGKDAKMRLWLWQQCNEFGLMQGVDPEILGSRYEVGTIPLSSKIADCVNAFHDPKYTQSYIEDRVKETNLYYGGLEMKNASNIIFPIGGLDGWRPLGKQTAPANSTLVPVVIEGETHCAEMYTPLEEDSEPLKEARKKIEATLNKWLGISNDKN